MDGQMIINLLAGSALAVIGWFARQLEARFDKIDLALEKLYDKLDTKADK
jgi:hypothetical protein